MSLKNMNIFQINAIDVIDQLEHAERRRGLYPKTDEQVVGVPSMVYHLPKAEPMLPGHTLLKPAMAMLKSAVKFPHRELEDGAGVYGNYDNLGIPYDGTNQRLEYSSFRRMAPNAEDEIDRDTVNNILQDLEDTREKENILQNFIDDYQEKLLHKEIRRLNAEYDMNLYNFHKSQLHRDKVNNRKNHEKAINEYKNKGTVKRTKQKRIYDLGARRALAKLNERQVKKTNSNTFEAPLGIESNEKHQEVENSLLVNEEPLVDSHDENTEQNITVKKTIMDNINLFNHLHVNSDAPDMNDFLPQKVQKVDKCVKCKWWFFNQDDFVAFKED